MTMGHIGIGIIILVLMASFGLAIAETNQRELEYMSECMKSKGKWQCQLAWKYGGECALTLGLHPPE